MYGATFRARNACVFTALVCARAHVRVHARVQGISEVRIVLGFTSSKSNDYPSADLQQFANGYFVSHTIGLPLPGSAYLVEIWNNGELMSSNDLSSR